MRLINFSPKYELTFCGEIFGNIFEKNNFTPMFRLYLFLQKNAVSTNINNTMHSLVMVKWFSKSKHTSVQTIILKKMKEKENLHNSVFWEAFLKT